MEDASLNSGSVGELVRGNFEGGQLDSSKVKGFYEGVRELSKKTKGGLGLRITLPKEYGGEGFVLDAFVRRTGSVDVSGNATRQLSLWITPTGVYESVYAPRTVLEPYPPDQTYNHFRREQGLVLKSFTGTPEELCRALEKSASGT
jgi:hypothetical protein